MSGPEAGPPAQTEPPAVLAVIATVGRSPLLEECLRSLRSQNARLHVTVVFQGSPGAGQRRALDELADAVVQLEAPAGFAAANNRGLAPALEGTANFDFVATVNDDAVLEPGWLARLLAVMEERPRVGAAQGLNLVTPAADGKDGTAAVAPPLIDSAGIRWNRRLQAVQRGHLEELDGATAAEVDLPGEVWGVSATAALYRIEALRQIAAAGTAVFDEALETYYEDVDLARRLRAAGWSAWCEPAARCRHQVSLSAPRHRRRLLVANRHLVLARLLGRRYWPRLPGLLLRDLADCGLGALPGWGRALARGLPSWHLGPSQPLRAAPPSEVSP